MEENQNSRNANSAIADTDDEEHNILDPIEGLAVTSSTLGSTYDFITATSVICGKDKPYVDECDHNSEV